MKYFKFTVVFLCIVFAVCFIITAAMLVRENVYDIIINDNAGSITHNVKYRNPQKLDDVPLLELKITCGYTSIEMAARYLGYDNVTEKSMYEENGKKITTSTNGGFYNEIKKQLTKHSVTRYDYLKNTEIIDRIYESLKNKMPVIFCFAAQNKNLDKSERGWVLHYGVIVGIDVLNDRITVNDPYGYIDTYSIKDFLAATRFDSYENMKFHIKLGFTFGLFTKNTVYIIEIPADITDVTDLTEDMAETED